MHSLEVPPPALLSHYAIGRRVESVVLRSSYHRSGRPAGSANVVQRLLETPNMPNYMLLLHEKPTDFSGVSAEEIQAIIGKYAAWRDGLAAAGRLVGGEKLRDGEGRMLRQDGDEVRVTDGPYSETKEVIGGYFTIEASDYDEAVSLSSECPHLAFGGSIELREVEPTG